MIPECAFTYPDGRQCRRIPRRGSKFCPGHGQRRCRQLAEEAYLKELGAYAEQLWRLKLSDVLQELSGNLSRIQNLIALKASRRSRFDFDRAVGTVVVAIDRIAEANLQAEQRAAQRQAGNTKPRVQ